MYGIPLGLTLMFLALAIFLNSRTVKNGINFGRSERSDASVLEQDAGEDAPCDLGSRQFQDNPDVFPPVVGGKI